MYLVNNFYLEALKKDDIRVKARIETNDSDTTINNDDISSIKYNLSINDNEKFSIGGVYGATVTLNLLNYEGKFDNYKFDNKEFYLSLRLDIDEIYTVEKFHAELVKNINALKIKYMTSLWIPQGKFYPTKVTKNEDRTITRELIDKTKYLDDEYICDLQAPFTLKQLYDDVHSKAQIISDTATFYNQDKIIETVPEGYTYKQILGYIAECACGFYIINRLGNGELRSYGTDSVKSISKGEYKKFLPQETYITIQKVKYNGQTIGANKGYILELDEKNPFINDEIAQNILVKMQGFTYIAYTYESTVADIAMDVGDKFDITNTNSVKYLTYIMNNSWEFSGAITQNWEAKGENELSNTYSSSKGPISQQLDNIIKEQIPGIKEEAIEEATKLLTDFNGGYVIKKDGELFISDNEDLDKAQHIWRWNINGLGYSSTGIDGPYGLAITMNGQIVADFIATGTMSAERINGGTLKLGGNNNTNGSIQVLDASGKELVTISKDGLILNNGTKLIGNGGVLSNLQFGSIGYSEINGYTRRAGEYDALGFYYSDITGFVEKDRYSVYIDCSLPNNFIVSSAYLTIKHISQSVSTGEGSFIGCGYARRIKASISDMEGQAFLQTFIDSDFYPTLNGINYTDMQNVFNTSDNTYTPSVPSQNNMKLDTVVSNDIGSLLSSKCRIKLTSANNEPNSAQDAELNTGYISAQLNVYGYLQ